MHTLHDWLYSFYNDLVIVILIILLVAGIYIYSLIYKKLENNIPDNRRCESQEDFTKHLELRYTYTDTDVKKYFDCFGKENLQRYQNNRRCLDVVFPPIYGLLIAGFIIRIYPETISIKSLEIPGVSLVLLFFPLFAALANWKQNWKQNYLIYKLINIHFSDGSNSNSKDELFRKNVKCASNLMKLKYSFMLVSITLVAIGLIIKFNYFLFPLRVPIIAGIILFIFPIISHTIASKLLQNLFLIQYPLQLTFVLIGTWVTAIMISYTGKLIIEELSITDGNFEYFVQEIFQLPLVELVYSKLVDCFPGRFLYRFFEFIMAVPLFLCVSYNSFNELGYLRWLFGFILGVMGIVFADVFMYEGPSFWDSGLNNFLTSMQLAELIPWMPGFVLLIIGLLLYLVIIMLFQPRDTQARNQRYQLLVEIPALFYALLLIWIMTGIVGGLTLLLDRYHVPIILSLITLSVIVYFAFEVDHYYELIPLTGESVNQEITTNRDCIAAIKQRLNHQPDDKKTLVVIAASGGGIQAGAWTVKVLEGLHKTLGQSFTQAIGLISSVSGGSVGTMFFLDRFSEEGFPSKSDDFEQIFNKATENCLNAVGWGMAGPDLGRFVVPYCIPRFIDRGYAMEMKWKQGMNNPDATLWEMRGKILQGKIPIPVFNATLVEDGRRFLISPMTFIGDNIDADNRKADADNRKAFDFNTLFRCNHDNKNWDLKMTTAARLSASFPYVSPVARNDTHSGGNFKYNYHVADGGYFDNSGMVTVVEWLDRYLNAFYEELKIKKILIVEINAFPKESFPDRQAGRPGWLMEWIGPLQAIYTVRDSTQISRGLNAVELLKKRQCVQERNVDIQNFSIYFPAKFNNEIKLEQPLSWNLTNSQKDNLKKGWKNYSSSDDFKELKRLWGEKWKLTKQWC